MLKFLTHKLRTHSLNEDNVSEKEEGRDSGTESDEETERPESEETCSDVIMKWNDDNADINMNGDPCACAPAQRLLPEPDSDLLYDHHSSEEELEVINNGAPALSRSGSVGAGPTGAGRRRRGASSPPPGAAPGKRKWPVGGRGCGSHDDDDDDSKVETPVRFRTSPPLEALNPRRCVAGSVPCSVPRAVPSGVVPAHGAVLGSEPAVPRRRRAPPAAARRHRPALDFDKMQQLKVSSGVRSWRGVGGAGGELSVFCW